MEGSVRTARQGSDVMDAEDKKIDQVMSELHRYGVVVATLQETKWFGDEVNRVDDSVVQTAGTSISLRWASEER